MQLHYKTPIVLNVLKVNLISIIYFYETQTYSVANFCNICDKLLAVFQIYCR